MTGIRTTIAELRELEAKATPGEWIIDEPHQVFAESCGEYVAITGQIETPERLANSTVKNNAALIAASRNALPILLDYIARLEAVADLARRCNMEMPLNDGTCELLYDLGDRLDDLNAGVNKPKMDFIMSVMNSTKGPEVE